MKLLVFIFLFFILMSFASCKKCRTCQCWKEGVEYEERNCAYGGGSSNKTQETWEEYLTDKNGYDYDSIKCHTE